MLPSRNKVIINTRKIAKDIRRVCSNVLSGSFIISCHSTNNLANLTKLCLSLDKMDNIIEQTILYRYVCRDRDKILRTTYGDIILLTSLRL